MKPKMKDNNKHMHNMLNSIVDCELSKMSVLCVCVACRSMQCQSNWIESAHTKILL